jgi:serine/threonine-protein kinase
LFGEQVDQRTDLWAAGAVLFECLTGRMVFDSPSLGELGALHMKGTLPDPAALNSDVPPALSRIILRALAQRPGERWQSAAELLEALETV